MFFSVSVVAAFCHLRIIFWKAPKKKTKMTKTEELPDSQTSEEFYEKYEPKEILGR